ncbi:MAG TPA: prepilin-type N-terminal cleavage/methylation domain-containing protein [Vicinamibacteria bacterium]|nr:prepilin-type N-terminal cleavage/methylation domain-containing protein [Vicinamibacteria bacterium]
MKQVAGPVQEGFSLIELLVAMTVTLIVTGAIYGLLTSGHSAFRREPELADRQQNIRLAMDIITRDIENAGSGMPIWSQVFTIQDPAGGPCNALPGLNGCGMAGALGNVPAGTRGGDSVNSDVLEVLGTDDRCTSQSVCNAAPLAGAAGTFVTREPVTACLGQLLAAPGGFVLLTDTANGFTIQPATIGGAGAACPAGGASPPNANLVLTAALAPWTWAGPPAPSAAAPIPGVAGPDVYLYPARVARYRIAINPDPADPSPALWRSTTGRFTPTGVAATEPGAAGFPGANSPWQMVARGIEDLQVEYQSGAGVWVNVAPGITINNYATIIRQVRVTLSARALAPQLAGQTSQVAGGAGGDAVRGQLVSVVTPRAAVVALQLGNQIR